MKGNVIFTIFGVMDVKDDCNGFPHEFCLPYRLIVSSLASSKGSLRRVATVKSVFKVTNCCMNNSRSTHCVTDVPICLENGSLLHP